MPIDEEGVFADRRVGLGDPGPPVAGDALHALARQPQLIGEVQRNRRVLLQPEFQVVSIVGADCEPLGQAVLCICPGPLSLAPTSCSDDDKGRVSPDLQGGIPGPLGVVPIRLVLGIGLATQLPTGATPGTHASPFALKTFPSHPGRLTDSPAGKAICVMVPARSARRRTSRGSDARAFSDSAQRVISLAAILTGIPRHGSRYRAGRPPARSPSASGSNDRRG